MESSYTDLKRYSEITVGIPSNHDVTLYRNYALLLIV